MSEVQKQSKSYKYSDTGVNIAEGDALVQLWRRRGGGREAGRGEDTWWGGGGSGDARGRKKAGAHLHEGDAPRGCVRLDVVLEGRLDGEGLHES